MELLAEFDVAAPDVVDILGAIDLHRLHGFSFWDSLILRSAIQSGCSVLLTKDLQKSREVDGVSIVNPFANIENASPKGRTSGRSPHSSAEP